MAVVDIEYLLEAKFVTSLQGIFAFDNKFIYNEDDAKTKIAITSDYPEDDKVPFKVPHIVVTNITFDVNLDNTLGRNFSNDIFGKDLSGNNVFMGKKFMNIIPYSVTLLCMAELFESKDLANKVVNYISFQASSVFDTIGLHITRASKGVSNPSEQYPQKIFQTPVSITGNLHWEGTKTTDIDMAKVLRKINSNLQIYLSNK